MTYSIGSKRYFVVEIPREYFWWKLCGFAFEDAWTKSAFLYVKPRANPSTAPLSHDGNGRRGTHARRGAYVVQIKRANCELSWCWAHRLLPSNDMDFTLDS